jgi:putative phage-type endonuclease
MINKLAKLISVFPTIKDWSNDKIYNYLVELFDNVKITVSDIEHFKIQYNTLQYLLNLPKVEQRSPEWFKLRESRLTASDLAQSMGKGKFGTREELLTKKAFPDLNPVSKNFFRDLPPLKWGTMFEDMGMRCYQEVKGNVNIYEFGLIPNEEIDCFGASPDGITETGVMVEMKCPYRRKFNGSIPEQYFLQIQGQLATCKLDTCDYVECYIDTYDNISEYEVVIKNNHEDTPKHGIIVEYMKDENYKYEYSPPKLSVEECIKWANDTFIKNKEDSTLSFIKMTPWKLRHIFIKEVKFDKDLWESCVPKIYQFWNDVEELRKKGIDSIKNIIKEEQKNTYTLPSNPAPPKPKYTFIKDSDDEYE